MGHPRDRPAARRRHDAVGRRRRLLPDQRAEPRARGAPDPARHPLQGHRRHPVLRPARGQGRARLPEGGREPVRRGVGEAGPQQPEARRSATAASASSTPTPPPTASRSSRRCAGPTTPASAARPSTASATFLELLDGVADLVADDSPAPLLEALLERSGYLDELRAERSIESEGRLENLAELVGSAQEAESVDQFLEQVSLVSDADEIDGDDSQVVLMTVHAAKGLEFPAVFVIGTGGRRVPPPPLDRRARRDGGGAPARLRGAHPGPAAPLPHPRLEPHPLRRHAVQPAEPVPRRDPRGAHRGDRAAAGEPQRPGVRVERHGSELGRLRVERRRRHVEPRPDRRAGHAAVDRSGQARRRGPRACRSATT